jgi:hypothetical protein
MNTKNRLHIARIDTHAAIAHAHAVRAEHLRFALAQVPGLLKRLAGKLRPDRHRLPQTGAWA